MDAFDLADLVQAQAAGDRRYLEFLRVPALSVGLYVLPAESSDGQQPHSEDEVYYVVSGAAQIRVDEADRPVQAGSLVYVAAHVPHHFHTITSNLTVLVFFAPAEYSRAEGGAA